jgi:anti-sigma factor RsiW
MRPGLSEGCSNVFMINALDRCARVAMARFPARMMQLRARARATMVTTVRSSPAAGGRTTAAATFGGLSIVK